MSIQSSHSIRPGELLSRSRYVLNERWSFGGRVPFTRDRDDSTDVPAYTRIPLDDWEDMGRPSTVTVTVEPGDLLNGKDTTDDPTLAERLTDYYKALTGGGIPGHVADRIVQDAADLGHRNELPEGLA